MKQLKDTDTIKRQTPYLGFVDLMDAGNVKLTIADVEDVSGDKVDGVREAKAGTYALCFKETQRKMLVQGRKLTFMLRTHGKKKSDWMGKIIEVYADPTVKFGRDTVGGLKIVGQA
jgi:hypothetical protein